MPIDPAVAIGAEIGEVSFAWTSSDVLLYHLALGAGPDELRYTYERDLVVVPTFATVAANLINLFDQKTVTQFVTTPYRDAFSVPDAQFFAGFNPAAFAAATSPSCEAMLTIAPPPAARRCGIAARAVR